MLEKEQIQYRGFRNLYDENGEWKLNPGNYKVYIGNTQPDKRSEELTGKKCAGISVIIE